MGELNKIIEGNFKDAVICDVCFYSLRECTKQCKLTENAVKEIKTLLLAKIESLPSILLKDLFHKAEGNLEIVDKAEVKKMIEGL
jgi:hypothetical protein